MRHPVAGEGLGRGVQFGVYGWFGCMLLDLIKSCLLVRGGMEAWRTRTGLCYDSSLNVNVHETHAVECF